MELWSIFQLLMTKVEKFQTLIIWFIFLTGDAKIIGVGNGDPSSHEQINVLMELGKEVLSTENVKSLFKRKNSWRCKIGSKIKWIVQL
jgi:hypothetical protein